MGFLNAGYFKQKSPIIFDPSKHILCPNLIEWTDLSIFAYFLIFIWHKQQFETETFYQQTIFVFDIKKAINFQRKPQIKQYCLLIF